MPDRLIEHLASHDAPCPACGYNLRGITRAVCPECGKKLSWPLRRGRSEYLWVMGLAGIAAAYGGVAALGIALLARHTVYGLVILAVLLTAPGRWRKWRSTGRAFGELPMYKQQELMTMWWFAAGFAWIFALVAIGRA